MNNFTKKLSAALLLTFILGLASNLWAQRNVSYRDLAMRNQERPVSFDFIVLPGDTDSEVKFTSVFSFSYSYLPFKKTGERNSDQQFYSSANLSMEVFKAGKNFNKRRNDDISVEGLEPVGRAFWADTAYTKTYEQSQSKKDHLHGYLSISLEPGNYNYVMQMKRGEETESRISRTQSISIEPYEDMPVGNIILGEQLRNEDTQPELKLTTMGNNVEYAKDFYLMAYLPRHESDDSYTLSINKLNVVDEDTSSQAQIYNTNLSGDDIRTNIIPEISSTDKQSYLNLRSANNGYAYALLEIPNSNFSNALYRVTIQKEGQERPVAQGTYRSLWVDIPQEPA
ncbi:MAG: hypothetical protein U5J63_01490 [Fodinibius sp.]|nr:hypothetical protein [Fodinibius sp.]